MFRIIHVIIFMWRAGRVNINQTQTRKPTKGDTTERGAKNEQEEKED